MAGQNLWGSWGRAILPNAARACHACLLGVDEFILGRP